MPSKAGWCAVAVFAIALPSHAYRMSAWVPSWDTKAVTTMAMNAGKLDEANPGWYTIAADGAFTRNDNAEAPNLRAAMTGIDIIPTIKNYVGGRFDGNLVATIIGSPSLREKHAESLTQLVVENVYAGIDIDYESRDASSKASFSAFVQLLAQKLHAVNKKLSVTVSAKTSDSDDWRGPAGEDLRAIGAAADFVKVMGYDNHWNGSVAGPIAPIDWLDAVATYAEATIPAHKIIIGLPWYGYDWLDKSAAAVVYGDAIALAQKVGAPISHDANGEATFSYSGRTVYFQDARSYAAKTEAILRKHPKIGGFAHWRAGGEDPAIWDTVRTLKNSSSSGATPVIGAFVVNAPAVVSTQAGKPVQFNVALTPINGFNGVAQVAVQSLDAFPGAVTVSQVAGVGAPAVITVTPSATAAGSYRIKVRMSSGTIVSEAAVTVNVIADSKRRAARH